jgi:hypothetical protein
LSASARKSCATRSPGRSTPLFPMAISSKALRSLGATGGSTCSIPETSAAHASAIT